MAMLLRVVIYTKSIGTPPALFKAMMFTVSINSSYE